MAITEDTAQAPCPIFAGRGINTTGFTLAMPEKIYLTCTNENKESERGLLSVFCYDLAESVYNDTDDRTAFLVYVKGGAYCNTITTGKMMHALDVLMEVDYEYTPTSDDRNAYARGARLQAYGKKSMDGGIMGAYINAQLQGGYTYTGTTSVGTFAGAVGAEIRCEAMGPGTTVTVTRMTSLLLWGRFMATVSGAVTMLQIEVPWQYAAVGGQVVGIEFTEGYKYSSGQTDFDIGIDFGDGLSVIAIDIGDVTTGITFTGTATTGINFNDETTTAIDIGACTTGISITGAVTDVINCSTTAWTNTFLKSHGLTFTTAINCMWFSFTDSVTSGDVTGIRMIIISSAASAGPDVRPFYGQATTAVGGYAASLTGGKFEASVANGTAVISGDIYGLEAKFSKGTTYSCANLAGIKVLIQTVGTGETITTVDTGLWIMNEAVGGNGRLMDSGIRIDSINVTNDKGYDVLIDGSGTRTTVHDTDRVKLLKFQDDQGTTVTMSYDRGDGALKFA